MFCDPLRLSSLLLLLAVACGNGQTLPDRIRPAPKTPLLPACSYFSEADASAVSKRPMKLRAGNASNRCTYDALDHTATIDFQIDPPAMADFLRGKPNVEPLPSGAVWNREQHQFAVASDDREIFGTLTGLGKDEAALIVQRVRPRL